MNVYDFDGTIYSGDSTRDFYFFCLRRHLKILKYLPYQFIAFVKFAFGKISKTRFKEKFYIFLKGISDIDGEIELFWDSHYSNIKAWYLENKNKNDLIISASPCFLLEAVSKRLDVRLIASRVDKHSGKTEGENCFGQEKVKRLFKEYPEITIDKFYSDSVSDKPLAMLAESAFLVKGNKITKWSD